MEYMYYNNQYDVYYFNKWIIFLLIFLSKIYKYLLYMYGGVNLKDYIEERVLDVAKYIIYSKSNIRKTEKVFCVSKSKIHKYMKERLPKINQEIAEETHSILELNKAERHIRGGNATKMKYKAIES